MCMQVLAKTNVRFEFGDGTRPFINGNPVDVIDESHCLIKVYATKDIKAGSELLGDYGPTFWMPKSSV